jgi:hypothetical protein
MSHASAVAVLFGGGVTLLAAPAFSAVLEVPSQYPTIQAAVDLAAAGDTIFVRSGSYCGAVLDKRVELIGLGQPTIVGCDTGPFLSGPLRVGFLLQGSAGTSAASGSVIAGFDFDGEGVSNTNLTPLAFGILGRFADQVTILHNRVRGTVQAITNTAGDGWFIAQNRITDLTVFDCPGYCTGGDGIEIQIAREGLAVAGGAANPVNRPENNVVIDNDVSGTIPDGFDAFGFVGIEVFGADRTTLLHNRLAIPDNPNADAFGQGILITNTCCGATTPLLPGARDSVLMFNDASRSQFGIVVEGSGGENTQGLVLKHNLGSIVIEGVEQENHTHRPFPHLRHGRQRWF